MKRPPATPLRRSLLDPRRWLLGLAGVVLLVLAPAMARAQGAGADSVMLQWTAPGDDGAIGTASVYHMRVSTAPITGGNWSAAAGVPSMPAPLVAGSRQSVVVRGLSRDTTYFFAIRAEDDSGNLAVISNVAQWDWTFDTAPPAAPTGLSATGAGGAVQVTWNANSESDLLGYSVYRATVAGGPYTRLTGSLVTNPSYLDNTVPAGATEVWYQVSASDVSANEGARSAAFRLTLSTTPAVAPVVALEPGYPNPSRSGQPVCMPLNLVGGGAGVAIDIVGPGGFRVRRLEVSSGPLCSDGSLLWDGRNEAGLEVAPGVY
ncbi:MAG: fibronectin type III domain-containing protein, partial [Candidatus Eisenbacteria bacterium]